MRQSTHRTKPDLFAAVTPGWRGQSIRRTGYAFTLAISVSISSYAAAQQSAPPECGSFDVYGTVEEREFLDHGDTGPTAGDQRVGRYILANDDGSKIGVMHFSSVVMPLWDSGEDPLMTTLHYNFSNGALVATSVIGLPSLADTNVGPDHDLQYAVTGGTGAFAFAAGTLETKTLDDGRRRMSFDITCTR